LKSFRDRNQPTTYTFGTGLGAGSRLASPTAITAATTGSKVYVVG
jgi:hypothetical protein